ncbi:MAG: hypothetical protein K2G85_02090 [Muribaculaceae bacterium]|nr:hypothetical protein [Muribaculaceae bacterium]
MNRLLLAKGILSLTAVTLITSCIDDKYDLTDIDTTTEINVKDLTIPVKLDTLTLKNVIDLDDDDLIKTDSVNNIYSIEKGGNIDNTAFDLGQINVENLDISPTNIPIYIKQSVNTSILPSDDGIQLDDIDFGNPEMRPYDYTMSNVNDALKVLRKITTKSPISITVNLSLPPEFLGTGNQFSFKDIKVQLPSDLIMEEGYKYDSDSGILEIQSLPITDGKATLNLQASGMQLSTAKGTVINGKIELKGNVGILGGKISMKVKNINISAGTYNIKSEYEVSGFSVKDFTGDIDYKMNDIQIDPISLNDLPDFLNNSQTNIIIENPIIKVNLKNPVGKYGIDGKGTLNFISKFSNGSKTHSGEFSISGENSKLAFCTDKANEVDLIREGYTPIKIEGLNYILSNGYVGLPQEISVSVTNLEFMGNNITLPVGTLGYASGSYNFYAPLAFGAGTEIYYNTTESGWWSEDIEKVNIYNLEISAKCTSKLPVNISLRVQPIDRNGKIIEIEETNDFIVPANCTNVPVSIAIKGKNGSAIKDFDGAIFEAKVTQTEENAPAIGPNIKIELTDLRFTVSGNFLYEDK